MTPTHRKALGGAALVAWAIVLGVSVVANVTFAQGLAQNEFQGYVMGAGAFASDLLKGAAPVALIWFLHKRRLWPAFCSLFVGLITAAFSLVAAIGFASNERLGSFDRATGQAQQAAAVQEDVKYLRQQRGFVPQHRPLAIVQAELAGMTAHKEWRWSDGCQAVKGRQTEAFCQKVAALRVEEAAAQSAGDVQAKLEAKGQRLAGIDNRTGDYQATSIGRILGVDPSWVPIGFVVLFVLMVEGGAGLGLTVALGLLTDPDSELGKALRGAVPGSSAKPTPVEKVAQLHPASRSQPPDQGSSEMQPDGPPDPRPGPPRRGPAMSFHSGGPSGAVEAPRVVRRFSLRPPTQQAARTA